MSTPSAKASKTTKASDASSSSKKAKAAAAPTAEPVAAAAPSVAPAAEAVPQNEVSTPVAPVTTAPVPDVAAPIAELFTKYGKNLQDIQNQLVHAKTEAKNLEKHVIRELKALEKVNQRKNRQRGNRNPSGFVKPTKISDTLADFLGKERGSLMARTEVTKLITQYVRANSLQNKLNGRFIDADAKLKALLNYDETKVDAEGKLSYFNLQRYLRGHFYKAAPAAAAPASPAAAK